MVNLVFNTNTDDVTTTNSLYTLIQNIQEVEVATMISLATWCYLLHGSVTHIIHKQCLHSFPQHLSS